MGLTLYPQQAEAYDFAMSFLATEERTTKKFGTLKGFAGTGKSTTVQKIVEDLSAMGLKVCMTAPYNKATKVLRNMARDWGLQNVEVKTIYSLLGLVLTKEGDKEVIVQKGEDKSSMFHVVVVDEASTKDSDLWKYILIAAKQNTLTKFLMVGDPGQLPPVGEEKAIAFDENVIKRQFMLTEIVRQAKDNPIIHNSMLIRQAMDHFDATGQYVAPQFEPGKNGDGGFHIFEKADLKDILALTFNPDWYPENCRFLCWTNEAMDIVNSVAHRMIYGKTEHDFVVGETVIFRSPLVNDENQVKVHLETEAVVDSITPAQHREYGFPVYRIDLTTEDDECYTVHTPIAAKEHLYQMCLSKLADEAKKAKGYDKKQAWDKFWSLKESMILLKHPYALTVHRSQGSTFENVIVHGSDILKGFHVPTVLRLMYVGVTRPSKNAAFVI